TIVAAVAPAVVVPCLFRLRSKGYGVAKGIPTLIIAVASIGDSTSVAVFGVVKSVMFSDSSATDIAIQGPLSIIGGLGFGILWGKLCSCIPEIADPFLSPIRILMLLTGGMAAVFVSEMFGYGGGGPLGCVTSAFVALYFWSKQGWKIDDNPVTTAFEIFWRIFQPILFSIAGARIKLNELDGSIVFMSCVIVVASATTRVLATTVVCIGCKLNLKEKAALGPVALTMVEPGTKEYQYAEKVLTTCVLSILLTVPTGALLTTLLGPRFLTKTKHQQLALPEMKRRYSRRPSIRDMSIEEECEDDENNLETVQENERTKTNLENNI
ncbi:Sodium/hydrogen exchanger 9B2, partial [Gonioctena quinquepunctata]